VAKTLAEQIAEREFITRMSLAFNPNSIKLGNRRSLTAPRQLDSPVDVALRRFSESSPGSPYDLLATIPAAFAGIPGDVQGLAYMIAGGDTGQYKPPFPTTRDFQESIGVNPNTRMSLLGEFIDPIPGPSLAMGTGLIKKGGKKATTSGVVLEAEIPSDISNRSLYLEGKKAGSSGDAASSSSDMDYWKGVRDGAKESGIASTRVSAERIINQADSPKVRGLIDSSATEVGPKSLRRYRRR
jgi:hypothetical protein